MLHESERFDLTRTSARNGKRKTSQIQFNRDLLAHVFPHFAPLHFVPRVLSGSLDYLRLLLLTRVNTLV